MEVYITNWRYRSLNNNLQRYKRNLHSDIKDTEVFNKIV